MLCMKKKREEKCEEVPWICSSPADDESRLHSDIVLAVQKRPKQNNNKNTLLLFALLILIFNIKFVYFILAYNPGSSFHK